MKTLGRCAFAPIRNACCPKPRINTVRRLVSAQSQLQTRHARRMFHDGEQTRPKPRRRRLELGLVSVGAGAACSLWLLQRDAHAEAPPKARKIRLSEVQEHGRDAERIWVVKGTHVYDITEWIPNHPGGEVILRAAGGNIDQYWDIFAIHQKQDVYDILEQYSIGEVDQRDLVDGKIPGKSIDDPFQSDPHRDSRLRKHSERPCNAETPAEELIGYITPNELFYVRNHLWVPQFDTVSDYTVTVELPDGDEKQYNMDDIRKRFKQHTITATLQCSGNRRRDMTLRSTRPTQGLPWDVGAIGNAEWTGALLRDVLADAGFDVNALHNDVNHVQFAGSEAYGASIPLEKAVSMRGDVLLAYEMNGQPLPRDHGFPLRVVVPGHVAARSVKWVNRITLSEEESQSQWQQRDYKCFGPYQEANDVDWSSAPAIQELPVQSAFTRSRSRTRPSDAAETAGSKEEEEQLELEGYALSGGGRRVIRVDVSVDDGNTWRKAELIEAESKGFKAWGWQRWKIAVPKSQAGQWLAVKAVDETYQSQPESQEPNWNFRGNLSTAWHRIQSE